MSFLFDSLGERVTDQAQLLPGTLDLLILKAVSLGPLQLLGGLASRVLASIVYQATPRDPLVLAAVVIAMSLLGIVAAWVPARRALSADPIILLREE